MFIIEKFYSNLGLTSAREYLGLCNKNIPPTNCLLESTEQCVTYNNFSFNNENYLQLQGTAQEQHMSCTNVQITIRDFDEKALDCHLSPTA